MTSPVPVRGQLVSGTPGVSHPGYRWCYGSTGAYQNPGGPFFFARYDDAPKGEPTTRTFGFTDTLDAARKEAQNGTG